MKTYRYWFIIAICALMNLPLLAQEYAAYSISGEMKEDAVAVVRNYSAVFTQSDMNNGEYKVTKVVTILNKQGDDFANFYASGSKSHEFKSFLGTVRDASGKVIKKIKKSDLIISSLTDNYTLADDSYMVYYEAQSPAYPFTVEYIYQIKFKNGILGYPSFLPYGSYKQSVEKAEMTIELPDNMDLQYKANYTSNLKDEKINGKHIYTVSLTNGKAYISEPEAPSPQEIRPSVLFAPFDFCYDSHCGNQSDWKAFGLWQADLLKGRDVIPAELTNKLVDMTKDAKTEREKVKIIYEYLQNNFRYVSIQLGIGGWQPIPAESVAKTNFGDCKGLSNLMKAMLKAVNIPANYCTIRMDDKKDLYKDFASFNQMNHVILLVPLQNDSIWLECTSQTYPFGYVHDGIAGHDALVIDENGKGGVVCRLPTYSDKDNKTDTKLVIDVLEDGSGKINATFSEHVNQYGDYAYIFRSKDREEHIRYINGSLKLPKSQIGNISTSEERSSMPSCTMVTEVVVGDLANKTGNRLFISACPLKKVNLNKFSSEKRVYDIEIDQGYSENDTIIFNIPELYTIESLPKDVNIETPYGLFKATAKQEGNQIIYIQNTDIYSGRYDKDKYPDIKKFFSQIMTAIKGRMVLRKV